jgi:hypothetical protein
MGEFNSQGWIPYIKRAAKEFYEIADKRVVSHKELFIDNAIAEYAKRLPRLKNEIFGDDSYAGKRIDSHKTIALYVQVFLEKPIFIVPDSVTSPDGLSPKANLMNEIFCYGFICTVLESWNGKSVEHKKLEEYRPAFLKLLRHYRRYSKYDNIDHHRVNSAFDRRVNFFTYALAHAIYFIERDFMVAEQ